MKAKDLKNSILQMAVQGKLAPQDPADEPASVLLERIRVERAKLIKEKKIKAPKGSESVIYRGSDGSRYEKRVDAKGRETEPVCIDDEIPFDIPEGWEWARLGSLASFGGGGTPDKNNPSFWGGNIPWASMKDIHGNCLKRTIDSITEAGLKSKASITICQPGQIIVSTRLIPGKTILSGIRCAINQDLKVVHTVLPVDYLIVWFNSHLTEFKRIGSGTTVPGIKLVDLENAFIPIPPLAEQRRIAERVSELMPIVEEYGKLEDEREALDGALPERLRKSVLQMAVEGKLVPQDPDDEPASVLLERISAERAKLIKEKKIKAPRGGESVIYLGSDGRRYEKRVDAKGRETEPVCIDDEIPFDIPDGWEWARLESVTNYIQRGKSPKYSTERKYPVVAQKCNQWSGFSLEKAKFVDPESITSYAEERLLIDGDLLWNSTGLGTLGRMAVYDSGKNPYGWAVADSHVTVIRTTPDWLNRKFAFLYFAGPSVQSVIEEQASGSTKQKELAQETVKRYLIPIPPLAEQRRIAERVSGLIALITNQ